MTNRNRALDFLSSNVYLKALLLSELTMFVFLIIFLSLSLSHTRKRCTHTLSETIVVSATLALLLEIDRERYA